MEALSCGLPVISSDLPFNDGILDKKNSIRVNPNNVDEIAVAIQELYQNTDYKDLLSKGAVIFSENLGIDKRAQNVIKFMSEVTEQC